MITRKVIKNITILFFILHTLAYGENNQSNRIEVLVNENIITKYDIIQRVKMNSILNRVEVNDENYNKILNAVIDELVTEKLKLRKINEYNINISKEEFNKQEKRFHLSVNYTKRDLEELFLINNINFINLVELIELELKWQKLIYGLYFRVTSVTEQEIIELITKNPDLDKEIAHELALQKQLDIKSAKLIKDLKDEATIEYR